MMGKTAHLQEMDKDEKKSPISLEEVIEAFLNERKEPKLKKVKADDHEEIAKVEAKYDKEAWLADAALRVSQIQQVTHAIKFSHPDAKGTSLTSLGNESVSKSFIGTHSLSSPEPDVVGNAAALDVYKFLKLTFNEQSILELCQQDSAQLATAFSKNTEIANQWMAIFASISEPKKAPASHTLAKQLYWPLGKGAYHLLQPLFSTSLVHFIRSEIREDRFSDKSKEARKARFSEVGHGTGYAEYPDLAIQKFGGTKPQNISQLNSERGGENYLLASLPPVWKQGVLKPPLNIDSVFSSLLGRRPRVKKLIKTLNSYLLSRQNENNIDIRSTRKSMVSDIVDEVFMLAAEIQTLSEGWSQKTECRLIEAEQFWLDPNRAKIDAEFAARRSCEDWQAKIPHRFANWFNARFSNDTLKFTGDEHQEWKNILKQELDMFRSEVAFDV